MNKSENTKEEKAFTASQVGSMLEGINDSIKLLVENMEIKFEGVYKRFDGVEGRIDGVEGSIGGINGRLDKIETKIDRLQDDIVEVKYELKNKVNREEFERLEKRVIKLEKVSCSH